MLYELIPTNGRKSFGGKATVEVSGGKETLFSYGTPIIRREADGALTRLWAGWSATTGTHIKSFCGLDKAGFLALPCKPTSSAKADAYSGTLYR